MPKKNIHKIIWIVEDQATIREGMQKLIKSAGGLHSELFENAESLLLKCKQPQCPDLLLLDLGLPGILGLEALIKIKYIWPDLKVLIFTIYEDDQHVFDALKHGATGYILKRDNPEKILAAILEALDGGVSMSRDIALKVIKSLTKTQKSMDLLQLSEREIKVLDCLSIGKLYKEIGDILKISTNTVNVHLQNIYRKLHVQNRSEAIFKYLTNK